MCSEYLSLIKEAFVKKEETIGRRKSRKSRKGEIGEALFKLLFQQRTIVAWLRVNRTMIHKAFILELPYCYSKGVTVWL